MSSYQCLDRRIQQWIFKQGWSDLRPIQQDAIDPILSKNTDVLISASTASGKTEAFFLPACSAIVDNQEGIGILYISPLKALINDQYRRLESLSEITQIPVTPWHGDSSQSHKGKLRRNPSGILLITPESLESLMMRQSGWVKTAFANLTYICIDEFHAFIGMERGQQLLSLLTRLEHLLGRLDRPIPRVALSATLGNLDAIPIILRPNPNQHFPCRTIKDNKTSSQLQLQVRGYLIKEPTRELNPSENTQQTLPISLDKFDENTSEAIIEDPDLLISDLYRFCRKGNHLVFANSRGRTEYLSAKLSDMCEVNHVPNEFFPHHGSLAKELRETLEHRLQQEKIPTTALCTMTLELGIDIGKVDSVIQVTPPHSVASLRQRMGRAGRRGDPAKLRMLISEREITVDTAIPDRLRLGLIQSLAMVRLLINQWYEPADTSLYHFSTLIHQILATIAQWGGIRAEQLYKLLCQLGIFQNINTQNFKQLLTHMGQMQLITQLGSGEITLGVVGEKLTNHYSFYAAFKTPEEYQIIYQGKPLGTLPIDSMIVEQQYIVFGGRKWLVTFIDSDKRIVIVERAKGGIPPLFGGGSLSVHTIVRQEMLKIFMQRDYCIVVNGEKRDYINPTAKELFNESIENFYQLGLNNNWLIEAGSTVYIFTWLGDKANNALVALLAQSGYMVGNDGGVIDVRKPTDSEDKITASEIQWCLKKILKRGLPTPEQLAKQVPLKSLEKFDDFLPEDLLCLGYGAIAFDLKELEQWLELVCNA